ncbi:MAG: hypothetical protein JNJ54_05695 [Myxococcaceae bacterium]|nr:hypothetical protein [Myxococcaceae bacterium]
MNGGYALKLQLPPAHGLASLEAALASVALSEGLVLDRLELQQSEADQLAGAPVPRLVFGVLTSGREAVLVPRDKFDATSTNALAGALAAWFEGPVAWVLDTDEGAVTLETWNGAEALGPGTGMLGFGDSPVEWYVEFVPPVFTALEGPARARLLRELEAARTEPMREVGVRFVAAGERAVNPAFFDDLSVTMSVGGRKVTLLVRREPGAPVGGPVTQAALKALDDFDFSSKVSAREVRADARTLDAVRRNLPKGALLDRLVRKGPPGFLVSRAVWQARGRLDDEPFEVSLEGPPAGMPASAHLGAELAEALAERREERQEARKGELEERYLVALHEGHFDQAARAYAQLYFPDAGDDGAVLARARAKIDELAELYGVKPRG